VEIHVVDPLLDSRWDALVARHPRASVFHDRGWLEALARTYSYKPYVLTTSAPGEPLANGIVFCEVVSWMTGVRLVSLPFSDHCEPLVDQQDEAEEFAHWMTQRCALQHWNYVELRPLSQAYRTKNGLQPSSSYWLHELDLRPSLGQIYHGLHKNSFQRKIQRAEREGITSEFYRLLVNTRKRQQLLPQPRAWFRNLLDCLGQKLEIRMARKQGVPLAAILALRHQSSVVYKYGCSDKRFHCLGAMAFLFWKLVQESKASGAETIDFGRTDTDNAGLLAFKDRLGTTRRPLTYYRYARTVRRGLGNLPSSRAVRQVFFLLPEALSTAAGRILYKHMG
jgi:CelD/BcsL family acetyltransferase involved in cellulose biosynthesis